MGSVLEFGPLRSTVNLSSSEPGFGTARAGLAHLDAGFLYTALIFYSLFIVEMMKSLCSVAYLRCGTRYGLALSLMQI